MARQKLTDAEKLELVELLEQGIPYYEICDHFDVSESTVAAYAAGRLGRHLPQVVQYAQKRYQTISRRNRRRGLEKEQVCALIEQLVAGAKPAAIARELGVHYTTIYNIATGRTWADLECVQQYVRLYGEQWRSEPNYILTREEVAAIRKRREDGENVAPLAQEYNVSESMISRIANGTRRQKG